MVEYTPEHCAVTVSDLERSIKFYISNFGFKEIRQTDKPQYKITLATLKLKWLQLELILPYSPRKPETRKFGPDQESFLEEIGTNHVALTVDDLNKAYDELTKKGINIITDFKPGESTHFFCRDPDGSLIEIK